ncbi:uncharacterized protein B4U80_08639 [Leptotrombidium deliense]|uniref:Integrase catalytic domain-containing protein n=1 Tax=Leptotrombidium deliense TaxID=299467 RepID=A0A443RWM4_9ACAR|nr:uncharacterized protein B4U80_08639 [Leptotrombidium deliense]
MNKIEENTSNALPLFLLTYRNTPHSTTGKTPAELFLGRSLRSRLDLLKPSEIKDKKQITNARRYFNFGDYVWIRMYQGNRKWIEGVIKRRNGNLSYEVEAKGKIMRRHIDQLRKRDEPIDFNIDLSNNFNEEIVHSSQQQESHTQSETSENQGTKRKYERRFQNLSPRKSARISKPPDRYGFETWG